jgi:hypothetical protein
MYFAVRSRPPFAFEYHEQLRHAQQDIFQALRTFSESRTCLLIVECAVKAPCRFLPGHNLSTFAAASRQTERMNRSGGAGWN